MKTSKIIFVLWIIMQVPLSHGQEQYLEHATILKAVSQFADQRLRAQDWLSHRVSLGNIDSRLHFEVCKHPLEIFAANGEKLKGRVTFGIKCKEPAWSFYLPANIQVYQTVVVAASLLPKGHRITSNDLKIKEVDTSYLRTDSFSNINALIGSAVKRTVRPGRVISSHFICVVCRGESVKIVARKRNVNVEMQGIALQDGIKGEIITVRNNISRINVEAQIHKSGKVEVIF